MPTPPRRFAMRAVLATIIAAATLHVPSASATPGFGSPVDYSQDLQLIEAQLRVLFPAAAIPPSLVPTQPTMVVPAPPGYRVVKDKELARALAAAITDEGANNTGGPLVTTSTLTFKAAQYLPKKAATLVTAAVTAAPTEAVDIVDAAVRAVPNSAPGLAGAGIAAVVLTTSAAQAANIAGATIDDVPALAAKITTSAIKAAKKSSGPGVTPTDQAEAITRKVIIELLNHNSAFAIEEVTAAAVKASATLGSAAGTLAASVITGIESSTSGNTAANQAAAIAAAVLARPGTTAAVVAAAQLASTSYDAQIGVAAATADAVSAAGSAATETTSRVNANQSYADIVVQAAQQAKPKEGVDILKAALDAYNGTVTGADIVSASVRGNQGQASKLAAEAVRNFTDSNNNHGALDGGDAAAAAIAGALEKSYGGIVTAVLKSTPAGVTNDGADVVASAITAAFNASQTNGTNGVMDIAKAAVKGRKLEIAAIFPAAVLGVPADKVAADPTLTALVTAGLVAANPKAVLLDAGLVTSLRNARTDDSDSAIRAADLTARATASNKNGFYSVAIGKLLDTAVNTQSGDELGIIYGSAAVNANGAAAVAAVVIAETGAGGSSVKAAATRTNRKLEVGIGVSVDIALLTKSNKTANPFASRVLTDSGYAAVHSGIFDIVAQNTFNNPGNEVYVATGAVAVQPEFANVISQAALFRAPGAAGKIIPAVFAYARLNDSPYDTPSAAAAITSQAFDGIIAAKLDLIKAGSELKALKVAASAAVKSAIGLTGPNISRHAGAVAGGAGATLAPSTGAAGAAAGAVSQVVGTGSVSATNATLTAVVTAAVKAGKAYYLEIAQAAVQTAVAVYESLNPGLGSTYDVGGIVAAVKAAAANSVKFNYSKIDLVADYGKSQGIAAATAPGAGNAANGAGAAGIVFYAHHNATGPAVTDISGF